MAARHAKHVIVRTDAGYHDRLVAANGKNVDATEVYREPRGARRAIEISIEAALALTGAVMAGTPTEVAKVAASLVPIVDERTTG